MATDAANTLTFLRIPAEPATALAALGEPVRCWFRQRFGPPTLAQRFSWPVLATDSNLLLCAPTGTGKTLAAFLPLVSRLLELDRQAFAPRQIQCLYLAPLKALTSDVRKNLRKHLRELATFVPAEAALPRIGWRTGDTSARVRKMLWENPPDILLTTPESLAVMLTQDRARSQLQGVRWLIVDEIHSLAANKRGADLALCMERLDHLVQASGAMPLQRIGLSATCTPAATVARFLVGVGRPCQIAQVDDTIPMQVRIEPLDGERAGFMARLLDRLEPQLAEHRTTLIFTNTRNLAERVTWNLRRRFPDWAEQIAVHHSALAAARRRMVERRLKQGLLRVAVSSTTLELGMDIGQVDAVVLVHPPGGVVRLLQRVGRAGHHPHGIRHGLILTASPQELLEATVTAALGRLAKQEAIHILQQPFDVLCQHLLGMAVQGWWSPAEAYALVCRASSYESLTWDNFQACLDYLSGRHRDGREWLPARLRWENDQFTVVDERTARLLRRNLGTILAEEPRQVRLYVNEQPEDGFEPRTSALGEVDDAFADRLQPGDRFVLDGRSLEYLRKERRALVVTEVFGRPQVPRWTGSGVPMSSELAQRIYTFRVQAGEALREGSECLAEFLGRDFDLSGQAVRDLTALFSSQECLSEIPDHHWLLIEGVSGESGTEYYVHTPLSRAGNEALARVVSGRLCRDEGRAVTALGADLGFLAVVSGSSELTPQDWRRLLAGQDFAGDLERNLKESDSMRGLFRQVATIGLMLLRNPMGQRRRVGGRDWAERRLYDQVELADPDFLFLRQALTETHRDMCDAQAAQTYLDQLPGFTIRCRWLSQISPFAQCWAQPNHAAEPILGQAEVLGNLQTMLTG